MSKGEVLPKVCVIFGASRGIGAGISKTLAKQKCRIVICSKTFDDQDINTTTTPVQLTGSIMSLYRSLISAGCNSNNILPLRCDVRKEEEIVHVLQQTISKFQHIDFIVYNAGAISWSKVIDLPTKNYDLMNSVNARGAYMTTHHSLKLFAKQGFGKIVYISPPIYSRFFRGKTPYAMSKIAMTVLMHGVAMEIPNDRVGVCSLWPATVIQSQVSDKLGLPNGVMRTTDVFADAVYEILLDDPAAINGKALIDEDYLRTKGVSDFSKYRCDKDVEPERIMPRKFPDLLVAEQDQKFSYQPTSKL